MGLGPGLPTLVKNSEDSENSKFKPGVAGHNKVIFCQGWKIKHLIEVVSLVYNLSI